MPVRPNANAAGLDRRNAEVTKTSFTQRKRRRVRNVHEISLKLVREPIKGEKMDKVRKR